MVDSYVFRDGIIDVRILQRMLFLVISIKFIRGSRWVCMTRIIMCKILMNFEAPSGSDMLGFIVSIIKKSRYVYGHLILWKIELDLQNTHSQ